jgi:hypothetical protein
VPIIFAAIAVLQLARAMLDAQGRGRPQRALSLFLAGATELCDRVVETSLTNERRLPSGGQLNRTSSGWFAAIVINNRMVSGEPAYLVRCEDNIERWLTEKDLRP